MAVLRYLLRKLLFLIPVILGITLVTFLLTRVIPGDPLRMLVGENAPPAALDEMRAKLGLDQPLYRQYLIYIAGLLRLDMGYSVRTSQPVAKELMDRFPATAELTIAALFITVIVGVPLGVMAATHRNGAIDNVSRIVALIGVSMPVFWLGLVFIYFGYFKWRIFPPPMGRIAQSITPAETVTGFYLIDSLLQGNWRAFKSSLWHIALPAIVLGAWSMAVVTRMTRSGMLEVLKQDYIRTARAKGLDERVVIYKHALRNGILPTTTALGLQFGSLLGGAVLTETVFSWPGMGLFSIRAISWVDYAPIQGFAIVMAVIFVLCSLLTDVVYALIDPRVRFE